MSATPPPDELQPAGQQIETGAEAATEVQAEAAPAASGSRGRTWAHGVPAMRLQRVRWRLSGRPLTAAEASEGAAVEQAMRAAAPAFPPHIRLLRAVVGVVLLALAWGGALAVYMLARAAFAPLARQRLLVVMLPRIAAGLGACLLAIVVATLLLVGAFALSLAVHPNDPDLTSPRSSAADMEE